MVDELMDFKHKLEIATADFIDKYGVSRQSAEAVDRMVEIIDHIDRYIDREMKEHNVNT